MLELTSKQKSVLRGLGQKLRPAVIVGKAGMSDSLITNVKALLQRTELLKVRLPAGPADERQLAAMELAEATGSAFVGIVGRNALLYRPTEDKTAISDCELRNSD